MTKESIKTLFVSTSYPRDATDWKGQFIRHLLFSLAEHKELHINAWLPPGDIPPNVHYCASEIESTWLKTMLNSGGIANIVRNRPIRGTLTGLKLIRLLRNARLRNSNVDLAHINWLQNALPFWGTRLPLVISVLGSDFALLNLPGMVKILRQVFLNRKVIICPNATWMVAKLSDYFSDVATIRYIPLGIDRHWFDVNPQPPSDQARKWLVILRVTEKKIGNLFDWGKNIFGKEDELHLFGPMQEDVQIPAWVKYHGPTHPNELINVWFPQAAGVISLSEHDEGRPQILLEAMASSLPVIASTISAHKDIITDKQTGLLVDSKETFEKAIPWLLSDNNSKLITTKAKSWIKKEIGTWDNCAQRYIDTYQKILGDL